MFEQLETRTKNSIKIRFETRIKARKSSYERGIAQQRAAHATVSRQIRTQLVGCCWWVCASAVQFSCNFGLISERVCCLSVFVIYLIYFILFLKVPIFNITKESY